MCFGKKLTREQLQALMARLTDADGMEEKDERGERDKELQELGHQRSKLVKHMENELTEKLGGKTSQTGRTNARGKADRKEQDLQSRVGVQNEDLGNNEPQEDSGGGDFYSEVQNEEDVSPSPINRPPHNTEQGAGTEETPRKMLLRASVVDQEEIASPSPRHLESVSW